MQVTQSGRASLRVFTACADPLNASLPQDFRLLTPQVGVPVTPQVGVPGQRTVMGALARQEWVPSEGPTSTSAELGRGCWRRAWLWHLLSAARLLRRRSGRAACPGSSRRRCCVETGPAALGSRR